MSWWMFAKEILLLALLIAVLRRAVRGPHKVVFSWVCLLLVVAMALTGAGRFWIIPDIASTALTERDRLQALNLRLFITLVALYLVSLALLITILALAAWGLAKVRRLTDQLPISLTWLGAMAVASCLLVTEAMNYTEWAGVTRYNLYETDQYMLFPNWAYNTIWVIVFVTGFGITLDLLGKQPHKKDAA